MNFQARLSDLAAALALVCMLALAGCAGTPSYEYRFVRGRTAELFSDGHAQAPCKAPDAVQAAIGAGNQIVGLPYARGGGHGRGLDRAYDCSGAVSHILMAANRLDSPTTSSGFRHYGERGKGKWISVYARRGHVFAVVAGLRIDTGWNGEREGPDWSTRSRPTRGYVIRHPSGL